MDFLSFNGRDFERFSVVLIILVTLLMIRIFTWRLGGKRRGKKASDADESLAQGGADGGGSSTPRPERTPDGGSIVYETALAAGALQEEGWHIMFGRDAVGPVALNDLRDRLRTAGPKTWVWRDGYARWVRAAEVPGLIS